MHKLALLGVIIALGAPPAAVAQTADSFQAIQLPGSLSVSAGTLAPSERGNVISSVTTEQGFTPYRNGSLFVVGFANVSVRHDSDGLPWNRTKPSVAGFKIVNVSKAGVVQAVVGVTAYDRGDSIRASKAVYASYWSGWRGDITSTRSAIVPDAFPGYVWASSGIVTAAEPRNWITSVNAQQGATVLRYAGVSVVPYVGVSAGADTSEFAWNNRTNADAGMKFSREVMPGGVLEIGMAQRHEWNRLTRETRVAPVAFVNLWIGWSPGVGAGR